MRADPIRVNEPHANCDRREKDPQPVSDMQTETEPAGPQQAQQAPSTHEGQPTHAPHGGRQPMERAEDLVNQASERTNRVFTIASLRTRQMLARAREEAEDMWAEAQDIRRSSRRHPRTPSSEHDSGAHA